MFLSMCVDFLVQRPWTDFSLNYAETLAVKGPLAQNRLKWRIQQVTYLLHGFLTYVPDQGFVLPFIRGLNFEFQLVSLRTLFQENIFCTV